MLERHENIGLWIFAFIFLAVVVAGLMWLVEKKEKDDDAD